MGGYSPAQVAQKNCWYHSRPGLGSKPGRSIPEKRFTELLSLLRKWLEVKYMRSQNKQGAISKRNSVSFPDRGRITMTRNFLICPSVPANTTSRLCLRFQALSLVGILFFLRILLEFLFNN